MDAVGVKTIAQANLKDDTKNICQNETGEEYGEAIHFNLHLIAEVFAHVVYEYNIRCDESEGDHSQE